MFCSTCMPFCLADHVLRQEAMSPPLLTTVTWIFLPPSLGCSLSLCPTAALAPSQPEPGRHCHGAEQAHIECCLPLLLRSQTSSITHSCLFLHAVACQPKPEAQPPCFSSTEQRLATLANYLHCPKGNQEKSSLEADRFCLLSPERLLSLVSEGFGGSILVHGKIDQKHAVRYAVHEIDRWRQWYLSATGNCHRGTTHRTGSQRA